MPRFGRLGGLGGRLQALARNEAVARGENPAKIRQAVTCSTHHTGVGLGLDLDGVSVAEGALKEVCSKHSRGKRAG